jgi:hypothetical protein
LPVFARKNENCTFGVKNRNFFAIIFKKAKSWLLGIDLTNFIVEAGKTKTATATKRDY